MAYTLLGLKGGLKHYHAVCLVKIVNIYVQDTYTYVLSDNDVAEIISAVNSIKARIEPTEEAVKAVSTWRRRVTKQNPY